MFISWSFLLCICFSTYRENDIAEIAKESGIDLQKEEEHVDIDDKLTKKKQKKKKEKSLTKKCVKYYH